MKNYYEGMGLGSASSYTGSYTQNVNMLNWMKKNGFKKSGTLESMVKSVGEEGLFLGRNDDHVLARDDWMIASKMTQSLINYAKQNSNSDLYHSNNTTSISDINLNITLPNVKNYESFKKELQNDSQFEKMIQSMTVGKILGGNSLNKHKFK